MRRHSSHTLNLRCFIVVQTHTHSSVVVFGEIQGPPELEDFAIKFRLIFSEKNIPIFDASTPSVGIIDKIFFFVFLCLLILLRREETRQIEE